MGAIQTDDQGNPILEEGRFFKIARTTYNEAFKVAKEYIEWQPSIWFGEDSWVYGGFWRWIGVDDGPSIREIKEESYFKLFEQHLRYVRGLGIKLDAFYDLQKTMLQKQSAFIERDIAVLKKVRTGVAMAPLVPVAMALGGAGLGYVGLSSLNAGTASFTLASSGSFFSAINVSALATAAPILFASTKGAFSARKYLREHPEQRTNAATILADQVFVSAVSAIPLAVVTGTASGAVPAGIKTVFVQGAQFLTSARGMFAYLKTLTPKQLGLEMLKMPVHMYRAWAKSWWKINPATGAKVLNKKLLALYGAGNTVGIIAEFVDRQFLRENADEKFFVDGKINQVSKFAILNGLIMGALGTPIITRKNLIERFLLWRVLDVVGNVGITYAVTGKVDRNYVNFNFLYYSSVGFAMGEGQRVLELSLLNSNMKVGSAFALMTALKFATIFPKTSIRNFFLEGLYG